jgi:hypothetical protein
MIQAADNEERRVPTVAKTGRLDALALELQRSGLLDLGQERDPVGQV